jgi:hypothetical protein
MNLVAKLFNKLLKKMNCDLQNSSVYTTNKSRSKQFEATSCWVALIIVKKSKFFLLKSAENILLGVFLRLRSSMSKNV